MKTVILCAVVLALACGFASAQVGKFDTFGFESGAGYALGDLQGQKGWYVELYGGTATVVDNSADPTEGNQALKLTAPSSIPDPEDAWTLIPDGAFVAHLVTPEPLKWAKVSFDIWREPGVVTVSDVQYDKAAMNRLHWWSASSGSPIGVQWEDGTTNPFLWSLSASSAPTISGSFVNLTIRYDFIAKTRSAWYSGALVCDAIPIDDDTVTGFSDIELYYEQAAPAYQPGTYGYAAYIDNLYVEYEVNPVPEPASWIALSVGVVGLIGLSRRCRQR